MPQPSPQHSITPADPKRPYGGLVPSQPKGTRAFQDAASYNQHLAQHQAYTAQATAQANTFINRNPYITQPTGNGPPTFPNNQDKTGTVYNQSVPHLSPFGKIFLTSTWLSILGQSILIPRHNSNTWDPPLSRSRTTTRHLPRHHTTRIRTRGREQRTLVRWTTSPLPSLGYSI